MDAFKKIKDRIDFEKGANALEQSQNQNSDYSCASCYYNFNIDQKICPNCGFKVNEQIPIKTLQNEYDTLLSKLTKSGLKHHRIIGPSGKEAYIWIENNNFNLLVHPKAQHKAVAVLEGNSCLHTCSIESIGICIENSKVTTHYHVDEHIPVGRALVGGALMGPVGAIIGGQQKSAHDEFYVDEDAKCFITMGKRKIPINAKSVFYIKDLIPSLKENVHNYSYEKNI